ncbi:gamma-aminobutyric acid receptor subunit epsilon isoform X2 [Myotis daubentonii]|uniref:gamma-aminobutyric acid receptor subunit epsilon isoform X2 n=1 Tax=Myotis daubentonii TaxID=98922 RepID=UPI002873F087|nr:gamma-aminobutyric acid receptor subunit epsilon isoform X2 [Myotis daubentonii]
MLTEVLLILLGLPIILPSRIEGTHVESEMGACAHHDDVYGPKPQYPKKKLPSEEIKPAAIDTRRDLGKLPAATQILDSILNNSDYKLRPGIGEKPTVVTVELSVNTLGPISIPDMAYSIDITFYQTWYDERLRFNGSFESFVLNGNMMSQLWIPDTFFRNSKKIHVYSITMHSQVVRIHKDGKVLYTDRMTIDAGCSFHMLKFPMDSHSCPLSFSSCDFMVITLFFNVSRRFGFNAVQNYVPSSMTTVISWISFWIKKESAPARTSLGITSVLTITTLGSCSQKNFPRESYVTALDIYIAICFLFCIFALVEFAVLNFLIHNHTRPRASPRLRYPPTRARARARDLTPPRTHANQQQQENVFVYDFEESDEENDEEDGPSCPAQQSLNPRLTQRRRSCCRICKYLCVVRSCDGSFWQQGRLFIHIYRLDNYSRVIFPVTFIFFNVLYWVICFNL